MAEFKVFNDVIRLIEWLLPIIGKMPRNYRFSLGLRIENTLYELTEWMSVYELRKDLLSLQNMDIKMKALMKFVRYAKDLKLITDKQHYAFIQQVESIGKQLGGWQTTKLLPPRRLVCQAPA